MDRGGATVDIETTDFGGVAWITLDHPGKLNAISRRMMSTVTSILRDLQSRSDLRATVVAGAGDRAFIGGAYVPDLHALDADTCRTFIRDLHDVHQALRSLSVPVIAAVHGYCIGAGMELAAACDFRLADRSATIGMPEVKVGMPSVIEAELLPRLIGWGKAREVMLTGGRYDAQSAYDMGFFQAVCSVGDLESVVRTKLSQILEAAPEAVRAQKKLLNAWDDMHHQSGLELGIDMLSEAYATGEPRERLARYLSKERP